MFALRWKTLSGRTSVDGGQPVVCLGSVGRPQSVLVDVGHGVDVAADVDGMGRSASQNDRTQPRPVSRSSGTDTPRW